MAKNTTGVGSGEVAKTCPPLPWPYTNGPWGAASSEHAQKKAESDGDISRPMGIPWIGKFTEKIDQSIQAKQV